MLASLASWMQASLPSCGASCMCAFVTVCVRETWQEGRKGAREKRAGKARRGCAEVCCCAAVLLWCSSLLLWLEPV